MDLPKYDYSKRMNCPGSITIKDVIEFADGKLNFAKHLKYANGNGKFIALEHIDMTLPVIIN
jgi:hypothetical protein